MDPSEILRLVDTLHRDKDIDPEVVFQALEAAILSAAKRRFSEGDDVRITIDRETGEIQAWDGEEKLHVDPSELGRISAQTARQVMLQKIREAERDVIYDDFEEQVGTIATGTVQRFEGSSMIVNLGRTEAILPRSEQISNEYYHPGERIRALVAEVKKQGSRVKIILSRAHEGLVRKLFELEVPEIAEAIIQIKGIAREPGHRTKIAVLSLDQKVDCVGACVGVRGTRIRNIVDELNGEKIDIVRWNEAPEVLIMYTLKPAEISDIILSPETGTATVIVPEDQLSLAIGRRGQNVRLASKLSGWRLDIMTDQELDERRRQAIEELSRIPDIDEATVDALCSAGFSSLELVATAEPEELQEIEVIGPDQASHLIAYAQAALDQQPEQQQEA